MFSGYGKLLILLATLGLMAAGPWAMKARAGPPASLHTDRFPLARCWWPATPAMLGPTLRQRMPCMRRGRRIIAVGSKGRYFLGVRRFIGGQNQMAVNLRKLASSWRGGRLGGW